MSNLSCKTCRFGNCAIVVFCALPFIGMASAQEPVMPANGWSSLLEDICEVPPFVCSPGTDLGLPSETPNLLVPKWALGQLQRMSEAQTSIETLQGYALGLSDKAVADLCDDCQCCFGDNGMVAKMPAINGVLVDHVFLQGQ